MGKGHGCDIDRGNLRFRSEGGARVESLKSWCEQIVGERLRSVKSKEAMIARELAVPQEASPQ